MVPVSLAFDMQGKSGSPISSSYALSCSYPVFSLLMMRLQDASFAFPRRIEIFLHHTLSQTTNHLSLSKSACIPFSSALDFALACAEGGTRNAKSESTRVLNSTCNIDTRARIVGL